MCQRPAKDYSGNTYMGIHLGTDTMQAVILNSKFQIIYNASIRYDVDLPEFGTVYGVQSETHHCDFLVNPVMYVKALDMLINCLKGQGANLNRVASIGGSAHHYGLVLWKDKGFRRLCGLNARLRLHEQLTDCCFEMITVSNMMRRHLTLENEVGGTKEMIRITGSKCYDQMQGSQIRKLYENNTQKYNNTVRISLMSSFLGSILVGNIASIEYCDGSCMNLLDIEKKEWSQKCITATAPLLRNRLMLPIATNRLQGRICRYYCDRWGFRPDCMVVSSTGTTATTVAGLRPGPNSIIIVLRASDNILIPSKTRPMLQAGHVMCHPTNPGEYLVLFSFRNGTNARHSVCYERASGNWKLFNDLLESTPMGNEGNIMVRFDVDDYLIGAQGTLRWNSTMNERSENAATGVEMFKEPGTEVRALIEGQMMQRRAFVALTGFEFGPNSKIIAVGTGAVHLGIIQVLSDVFNTPVYTRGPNSQPTYIMGAAYRARYAFYEYREAGCNCRRCRSRRSRAPLVGYEEYFRHLPEELKLAATPQQGSETVYGPLLGRFQSMCKILKSVKPTREEIVL